MTEYVDFENAISLAKMGYKGIVDAYYDKDGYKHYLSKCTELIKLSPGEIGVPTVQDVFTWLCEVRKVKFNLSLSSVDNKLKAYEVLALYNEKVYSVAGHYDSVDEALRTAVEEVVAILIEFE